MSMLNLLRIVIILPKFCPYHLSEIFWQVSRLKKRVGLKIVDGSMNLMIWKSWLICLTTGLTWKMKKTCLSLTIGILMLSTKNINFLTVLSMMMTTLLMRCSLKLLNFSHFYV
eukprot:NODE_286_length_10728_cov_0.553298.p11 type:complete len:113 gc:universal NODE_286_length_10728_cov_0.553298:6346-6008(-)